MSKKNQNTAKVLGKSEPAVAEDAKQTWRAPAQPSRSRAPQPAGDGLDFVDDAIAVFLGILCIAIPVVVEPGIRDLFQLPKQLWLADGAAFSVALLAVLAFAGRPLRFPKTPLTWAMGALLASIGLSMLTAPEQTGGVLSIFARYDLHRWVAAAAMFAVTLVGISAPRRLAYVAAGLLVGGLIVAFIGIGEQHDIAAFLPQAWLDHRVAVISKPGSTFGNRNMAAEAIVAVMPVCYAILAMAVRWWEHGNSPRAWLAAAVGGLTLTILGYYLKLTVTRSAWLGAALGLVVAGTAWLLGRVIALRQTEKDEALSQDPALPPRRSRLVPLVLALGFGALSVTAMSTLLVKSGFNTPIDEGDQKRAKSMSELVTSSFDTKQGAAQWRFGMWASTWEAIKANPFGMGAGNWRVIYPQYVTQREKNEMFTIAKQPIRAHQDFLQMGAEYGVQGLAALLALIGLAVWLTARAVAASHSTRWAKDDGAHWLAAGAAASLAAIFAICGDALFSFPLQLPAPTFLFCLHLGIIGAACAWLTRPVDETPPARTPQWLNYSLAALAGCAIVGLLGFSNYKGLHERWMTAEVGFTKGRSLQKQGRPSEGLTAIREAIAYNPDDFQNHFIEALNFNSMGQTKEAIAGIEASVHLYPNLLNAWVNLAMFNRRIGNDKKMLEAIQTALKLKPDELVAINTWAQWLEDNGKYDEELALLRPQLGAYKSTDPKAQPPPGRVGYVEYRKTAWPADDPGLLGAYKTTLKHAAIAARKLGKHDEAAVYFKLIDDEGVPNDRPDKAKRKEWLQMASDVAQEYAAAGKWSEAFTYAKRAAELAENGHGDLKRAYVIAAARVGKWDVAAHEASVTLQVDAGQKDELIKGLEALKADQPQDAAKVDAILAQIH